MKFLSWLLWLFMPWLLFVSLAMQANNVTATNYGINHIHNNNWLNNIINAQANLNAANINPHVTPVPNFFSEHALIFFYGSQCQYCQQFAPILKHWAQQHQAPVLALALDNKPLAEFTQFKPATTEWINVAFKNQAITYPAVFIANHYIKSLYPVSFGALTPIEFNERMQSLIAKIQAYENQQAPPHTHGNSTNNSINTIRNNV